jgi:hypothetical protein
MVDLVISDLLSLALTIAIIATLLITLYFSRRQIQAFATDLESRVLNDIDEKFGHMGDILYERPEMINRIYKLPNTPGPAAAFAYYVMSFAAHIFHMRQRGKLKDNESEGWHQWMKNAFQFGTIGQDWTDGRMEMWSDPEFRAFVRRDLLPLAAHGVSAPPISPSP